MSEDEFEIALLILWGLVPWFRRAYFLVSGAIELEGKGRPTDFEPNELRAESMQFCLNHPRLGEYYRWYYGLSWPLQVVYHIWRSIFWPFYWRSETDHQETAFQFLDDYTNPYRPYRSRSPRSDHEQ